MTTSDFGLQSFKYQGLAIATDDRSLLLLFCKKKIEIFGIFDEIKTKIISRQESQETTTGKRVSPDWNLGLGQPVLDLQVDHQHHHDRQ